MFCPKCGSPVDSEGRFCPNCGGLIEAESKNIGRIYCKPKSTGINLQPSKRKLYVLIFGMIALMLIVWGVTAAGSNGGSGLFKIKENGISERQASELVDGYFKAFANMDSSKMKTYLTSDYEMEDYLLEDVFKILDIVQVFIPNKKIASLFESVLDTVKDMDAKCEYVGGSLEVQGDEAVANFYVSIDCKVDKILKLAGIDGYSDTFEVEVLFQKENGKWLIADMRKL